MKSLKSFFSKILEAFGWHAEKPLCNNADGQPLVETVFLCVNDGEPLPLQLEGAIDYLKSVVLGQRTHKILALTAGRMEIVSEITTAEDLRNSLEQGLVINMVNY